MQRKWWRTTALYDRKCPAVQVGAFYSQLAHLFKGTQGTYPSPPGIRRAQLATSSFVLVWLPAVGRGESMLDGSSCGSGGSGEIVASGQGDLGGHTSIRGSNLELVAGEATGGLGGVDLHAGGGT